MSDMNFPSRYYRWMVAFVLWKTIGSERLKMCLDRKSVCCGEGVAAGGWTIGTLVVSFERSCTLGTIVGSFDWTFTLGTLVIVGVLLGGSRRSQLLNMSLESSRILWMLFLQVVGYCFSQKIEVHYAGHQWRYEEVHPWMVWVSWGYHEGTI